MLASEGRLHRLYHGDCIEQMRSLDRESVDAIICDPPYSLGFMGKEWDTHTSPRAFQSWCRMWAREALRVLKPGGHLVAFGGTRTYHRLAAGLEDAGFEIRDQLQWLYGSGFPKSLDVSKAIDKAAGAAREVVGTNPNVLRAQRSQGGTIAFGGAGDPSITAPATPDAERWQGWGTALKPAHEPIVLARKPLVGTVARNVLEHGTGALNIDGTRIGETVETWPSSRRYGGGPTPIAARGEDGGQTEATGPVPAGRWPANVILDEEAGAILDAQTGNVSVNKAGVFAKDQPGGLESFGGGMGPREVFGYGDTGGPSRFFYTSKASTRQRNAGLHEMEKVAAGEMSGRHDGSMGSVTMSQNHHPTVKPLDVMRWLCRLVTPPGGLILDPFTGSGTTGMAAIAEGFRVAGCEMDAAFLAIADTRIRESYVLAP